MIKGLICVLIAYLIGSINFSIIICKFKNIDIKKVGSGNAGATNMVRALGKKYGVIVFLLDFLKGAVSCAIARFFAEDFVIFAGIFAILGHIFPLYHGFKGGKGVSTTYGAVAVINIWVALIVGLMHLILIKVTGVVSVSTLISFVILPFAFWIFDNNVYQIVLCAVISVIVIYAHRSNIKRLIKGEENTFKK